MRRPVTLWSLMIGVMVWSIPLEYFSGMVWFQVHGESQCYSREWVWNSRIELCCKVGCREEYCEYSPATGILCWVYNLINESYLTHLSGLLNSKIDCCGDSWLFPRRTDISNLIFWSLLSKSNRGRGMRPALMQLNIPIPPRFHAPSTSIAISLSSIPPSPIFPSTLQDLQWLGPWVAPRPSTQEQPKEVTITWHF